MFWSSETLAQKLPSLISPYSEDRIDCAAYTLSVGDEVYVSPSDQAVDPKAVTIRRLSPGQSFAIPPGQFAFLITYETVSVPSDAIALISIRARVKFRGLVNVSGFHVDPGYVGQLTFSVFNAGPVPIHLKQGDRAFLIWYANLDRPTENKKMRPRLPGIDTGLVSGIAGELRSFASLAAKIEAVQSSLAEKISKLEKQQVRHNTIFGIAVTVLAALLVAAIVPPTIDYMKSKYSSGSTMAPTQVVPGTANNKLGREP